ncbi:uncharacterized protein LOC132890415 isoform X2 [Neoarius graeffei]|uniref:uncharacterized protein LOC132890415 isoform X2 n=1 Tax=Neoarius graeffei TaxID=443677 RepID=UPI00298BE599|nr:uncharacterized protein LOC132890415 isoform X2 [Neoarius graeffei]
MAGSWVFILTFCTINTVQTRRKFSHSVTKPDVYQLDEVLCVDIGDSVTLQCCIFGKYDGPIMWYKQPNRKQPQLMSRVFTSTGETFFNEFQNLRFQVKRSSNRSNLTISNIIQSDEAMYYCATPVPYSVFGNGTYLKIKVGREPTLHGNSTNMNTQEKTVLGLGTALGLCALLIFCLIYFILRRRKWDKTKASIEFSPGAMQESEAETLNYAALKFSKRKAGVEKRKAGSSHECVYSEVKSSRNT